MMTGQQLIYLKPHVHFVEGFRNGLIVNCKTSEKYLLDKEAKESLSLCLSGEHEQTITDALRYVIGFLQKEGLATVSNAPDGQTRRPQTPAMKPNASLTLQTVWLELRKACNLHCKHCYNASNPNAERCIHPLSQHEWFSIIEQLMCISPRTIILIGGEPLMYDKIEELITFIRKQHQNSSIVVYSNLTLITPALVELLVANGVMVTTSIYSKDARIHDQITGVAGSHSKTIAGIELLRKSHVPVKANTTVMSINEKDVVATCEFIQAITGTTPKVDVVRCVRDDLHSLRPHYYHDNHLIESASNLKVPCDEKFCRNARYNPCWYGKLNIFCDGSVSPCIMSFPKTNSMNLRNASLVDVMKKYIVPNFWEISKDKINVCRDCEYRYICHDCRPISSGLFARANNCCYNPYIGSWSNSLMQNQNYQNAPKVDAQYNDSPVAFVFSCPGQEEEKHGYLCAGQTGDNLKILIMQLYQLIQSEAKHLLDLFVSDRREDYFITNASNCVHYKTLTNNSEPGKKEILVPENLSRLNAELKNRKIVVFCGKQAEYASKKINISGKSIVVCHLSNRGLVKYYKGIGREPLSIKQRIQRLAGEIIGKC